MPIARHHGLGQSRPWPAGVSKDTRGVSSLGRGRAWLAEPGQLSQSRREAILVNVLDPNREVNPQFVNYVLITHDGRSFTGMITGETANSVTLTGRRSVGHRQWR